jgi:hypothetical protein
LHLLVDGQVVLPRVIDDPIADLMDWNPLYVPKVSNEIWNAAISVLRPGWPGDIEKHLAAAVT